MIYFIDDGEGLVKIGYTADSPERRLKELQTGNGKTLRLIASLEGGRPEEHLLHGKLGQWRTRGEWFQKEGAVSHFLDLVESFKGNEGYYFAPILDTLNHDQMRAMVVFCEFCIMRGL